MDDGICSLGGRSKNIGVIPRSDNGFDSPRLQERNLLLGPDQSRDRVACGHELLGDGAADIARRSRNQDLQGVSPWRLPANLPGKLRR